jgi:DNA polymerase III epsilon subunit-like protein
MPYIIFFDTETTGLPKNRNSNALESKDNWPDIVSVAWAVYEHNGTLVKKGYSIVKPDGWIIEQGSINVHGITEEKAYAEGRDLYEVLSELKERRKLRLLKVYSKANHCAECCSMHMHSGS